MNKHYVIVGGVAAGATAAARLRRQDEDAEITILEKGPYVSFANCGLPYFISGDIKRRSKLILQTPEGFWSRYRVNVRLNTEAVEIDRTNKRVLVRSPEGEEWLHYDKLLLGQGGRPIIPNIQGLEREGVFTLWTIPDMDKIDQFIKQSAPKTAVVVGGGFIGLEMVEALHARGIEVSLVELAPKPLITMDEEFGAYVVQVLRDHGVTVYLERSVQALQPGFAVLSDGETIPAELVVLSIGVQPNLDLARISGLALGERGGLAVDEHLRTSDPDIFAAGDMVEIVHRVNGMKTRIPLAGPANRQGRIAAMNMAGGKVVYKGGLGTSVVKIFETTAASTGLNEKAATNLGMDVGVSLVVRDHHVSYYPGNEPLMLKLVYDRSTRRLLGAQAMGQGGC
jgi:NADPH-dependent 2,4-dienoyl-CoA reductase/sulfur reductase-like enzyme